MTRTTGRTTQDTQASETDVKEAKKHGLEAVSFGVGWLLVDRSGNALAMANGALVADSEAEAVEEAIRRIRRGLA